MRISHRADDHLAEALAQLYPITAAAWNLRAIAKLQTRVAALQWLDLGETIQIHDIAAVHSYETGRIEPLLDPRQR
jgi:hypothetical protein